MSTEELAQPQMVLPIDKPSDPAVAALKEKYTQEGWTSLMRNQEATSQVCVNCKINPPEDDDEPLQLPSPKEPAHQQLPTPKGPEHQQLPSPQEQEQPSELPLPEDSKPEPSEPQQVSEDELPKAIAPMADLPEPTLAQLAISAPSPVRPPSPLSPPSNRVSLLDPMLDAVRKSYRSPSGRIVGGKVAPPPPPPSNLPPPPPPQKSGAPFPLPPKTPPPIRPPTTSNVVTPLSPPSSPPAPKLMPRDKRRSPQSSVVVQGNAILPPPPAVPRPRAPSRTTLPTPPSSMAIAVGPNVLDVTNAQVSMQESVVTDGQGSELDTAQDRRPEALRPTQVAENEDDKGLESQDEFEDAEEEMSYKPKEESTESQQERISRLMGQKMVQGWTMMHETCPNPACNGVPLMRSREKKECCVGCGQGREQDLKHEKNSAAPSPTGATAVKPSRNASRIMPPALRSTPIPIGNRATSPLSSPCSSRPLRDLVGRTSGPVVLPLSTPMSPSFGMSSQQIMSKYQSEDLDKLDDEEMKRHMQLIGKVSEFSTRSLPPVPAVPASASRPTSTYSNTSDKERHYRHQPHPARPENAPPRASASPEVHAMIDATYKTMSTLLSKLEACRLALEVSESPKETHALTNQIKGLMECLKACREVL
ncbi:hypothetical protein BGX34_002067 [Mortierella sp. NVP85]|nr:hypothetical protein BGX34_002067 [Mortierella sp. NVP85]